MSQATSADGGMPSHLDFPVPPTLGDWLNTPRPLWAQIMSKRPIAASLQQKVSLALLALMVALAALSYVDFTLHPITDNTVALPPEARQLVDGEPRGDIHEATDT